MNDIRYTEMCFLQMVAESKPKFLLNPEHRNRIVKLFNSEQEIYPSFIMCLLEEDFISTTDSFLNQAIDNIKGIAISGYLLAHPRQEAESYLWRDKFIDIKMTYKGLRRIEELRELLKRDRILEPFGILLDIRYFHPDLDDAVHLAHNPSLAAICIDMDNFKQINDKYGHEAGDEVMKNYLSVVKKETESRGKAYRGRGDEVSVLLLSVDNKETESISENIRKGIESSRVKHNEVELPPVTASIGFACSPPHERTKDIYTKADRAQQESKKMGKNRVTCAS